MREERTISLFIGKFKLFPLSTVAQMRLGALIDHYRYKLTHIDTIATLDYVGFLKRG